MGHRDFKTTLIYPDYQPSDRRPSWALGRKWGAPPHMTGSTGRASLCTAPGGPFED
jgi:hypothetical protein